jgi:DNA-binding NarL/FixJ family response regulator
MVVNWEGLSTRGAALMRQVGIPVSEGYSERQIATELQTSKSWVSEALGELQAELRRLG